MTVHSNDRASWLTKLTRISERSAKDKGMIFNNIGHLITTDLLKAQYQRLDGKKAVGIDGVTKVAYGESLDKNIQSLIQKIRRGTYRPKAARLTKIPKEDGSKRPLAISCLEDKLVQLVVSKLLMTIYEPLFLSCSFGYRPGKNCHDALRALNRATYEHPKGAIVEIDIRQYFNTIPHEVMMKLLRKKISDRRFLRLIQVLMRTPILEDGKEKVNTIGCPQGSILSPIISNIYLHHVIDKWFESIKHTHLVGKAKLIRFADDMVFAFERRDDAQRFYQVLPKRLAKAGLTMHQEKSQVISAGRWIAQDAHEEEGKRVKTFNFLGFTCYWGRSRKGFWRLKYTTRKDRFSTKLKGMREYLWKNLHTKDTAGTLRMVIRVVRGWINYHAVSDNQRRIAQFLERTKRILHCWFNRRGGRRRMTWDKLLQVLTALGFPKRVKIVSMF